MKDSRKVTRRRYSAEFKAQILDECSQPAASVSSVALLHGINANVVHKWRRLAQALRPCRLPRSPPWHCLRRLAQRKRTSAWNCAEAQQP